MSDDFRQKIRAFAERMVSLAPRCSSEESTKLFLVLPFLGIQGYDVSNPDEVCPEHSADFSEKDKNRVDFAILKDDQPVIAIECKMMGMPLRDERGQLRSYFNAAHTVKMGVITDGLVYEFYADSDEPNMMDQAAFLSFDLRDIANGKMEDSTEDGLRSLQKGNFDPDNIGAEAKRKLVFQNLVQQLIKLSQDPSEIFVRMLLQNAGVSHVRTKALAEYRDLTKGAFREFVNLRIIERLDLPPKDVEKTGIIASDNIIADVNGKSSEKIITTEKEIRVFEYVKRRLAFLIKDNTLFEEIDKIDHKDYKGKFVIFYQKERSGRLFDFYDGDNADYRFDFGQNGGEISAKKLSEIDGLLSAVFLKRVEEISAATKRRGP